jgi:hypothetical protein
MTTNTMRETALNELTEHEIEGVSGGALPLIAVAVAVGKGFVGGVGVAAAVHTGVNFVRRLAS